MTSYGTPLRNSARTTCRTNVSAQTIPTQPSPSSLPSPRSWVDLFPPIAQTTNPAPTEHLNLPWGDPADTIPTDSKTLRLYYQNINGISTSEIGVVWGHICHQMTKQQAGIFGFTEPNLNWSDRSVRETIATVSRRGLKHYRMQTSESVEPGLGRYKPGGTVTVAVQPWCGRISNRGEDALGLGRWSWIQLSGTQNKFVYVMTVYRPVAGGNEMHNNTIRAQQRRTLRRRNDDSDPRDKCIEDLIQQVNQWQSDDNDVIIMIDANEQTNDRNSGLARLLDSCQLVDLVADHHAEEAPRTYQRSSRRLDYILGTRSIQRATVRSGYYAFNEILRSDHRAAYIDLDYEILLGSKPPPYDLTPQRILKSTNLRVVVKYLQHLHRHCDKHQLKERSEALDNTTVWDAQAQQEIEDIDQLLTTGMLKAEKKCGHNFKAPWSPQLHNEYLRLKYWSIALSGQKNGMNVDLQLASIVDELPQGDEITDMLPPYTQQTINTNQRKARKLLTEARRTAAETRRLFLATSIEMEAMTEDDSARLVVLQRIQQKEHRQNIFQQLRTARNSGRTSGLSRVEIPSTSNLPKQFTQGEALRTRPWQNTSQTQDWKLVDTREALETALLMQNEQHFAQAQGSPFTVEPLFSKVGYDGLQPFGDEILAGTADLDSLEVSNETKLLLQAMQRRAPAIDFNKLEEQEVEKGYRKWRESTSTSPSGRHLGHYKALLKFRSELEVAQKFQKHQKTTGTKKQNDPDEEPDPPIRDGREILGIHVNILNATLSSGYSLTRWHTVHNLFLEKDPGQPRIHRLRTIHLIEADWNLLLKFFGAFTNMRWAEQHGTIDEAQGGGRPGRSAIDVAVKKELVFSNMRLMRQEGGVFDNDATACFDRVIENQSNLSCKAQGAPDKFLRLHANTLQQMHYHPKTQYGVCQAYNQHRYPKTPFWGSGQGAGDSVNRWVFTSTPMLQAQRTHGQNSTISSPDATIEVDISNEAYMDDTYQIRVSPSPAEDLRITQIMQSNAQLWERLLHGTGGKLNLGKCSYQKFQWQFAPDGTADLCETLPQPGITLIESDSRKTVQVKSMPPSEAYKSLGVKLAPDGNSREAAKHMTDKITELHNAIQQCRLTPSMSWVAYQCVILPSISYTLPATLLGYADLDQIQKPIINRFLNLMGFNRHMPRAVVFAPIRFGGLGMTHLGTEQGVAKVLFLIRHIRSQTTMGRTLLILIHNYQLAAGISKPILQQTHSLPHCEGTWLDSVRDFLHIINGQVELEHEFNIPDLREHDQHLMDVVLATGFSLSEQFAFNRCRLYLQVTTVSEITDQTGKQLINGLLDTNTLSSGNSPLARVSKSTLTWPRQPCPDKTTWRVWCRILKATILNSQSSLRRPLGQWYSTWNTFPRRWLHTINRTTKTLYIRNSYDTRSSIRQHECTDEKRLFLLYETRGTIIRTAPNAADIEPMILVQRIDDKLVAPIPADTIKRKVQSTQPETIDAVIAQLPLWEAQLIENFTRTNTEAERLLKEWVQTKPTDFTLSVCDGSVSANKQGSFGWVIDLQETTLFSCKGPAPGRADLLNSFRAEGYGMLSVLRFWLRLTQVLQLSNHATKPITCQVACDNESLIKRISAMIKQRRLYPSQCSKSDSDVTASIWTTVKDLEKYGFSFQFYHVRGHQDATDKELTHCEMLNVEADFLAGSFHNHKRRPNSFDPALLQGAGCLLRINDTPITSKLPQLLREASSTQDLRDHLSRKFDWASTDIEDIDWSALGAAMSRLPSAIRPFVQKMTNGWLPLLSFLKIQDSDECDRCPSCEGDAEDFRHFLRCKHVTRAAKWSSFLDDMDDFFIQTHTDQGIRAILRKAFRHLSGKGFARMEEPQDHYQQLWHSQQRLGWIQLLQGRLSQSWAATQDAHLTAMRRDGLDEKARLSNLSGDKWAIALIKKMWIFLHQLWKSRNEDLHGTNQQVDSQRARDRLRQKIHALYAMRTRLGAMDLTIYPDLEILTQGSNRNMQEWLLYAEPFIISAAKAELKRTQQGMRDIRTYFRPNVRARPRHDVSSERPP